MLIGLLVGLAGYFLKLPQIIKIVLYIISYSMLLYRTTINAIKLIVKSKTINENFLITISCIGALLVGEVLEGMMVIVLYSIGKILEERAINKSRQSIKSLLDIKQPYANKKYKSSVRKIFKAEVKQNEDRIYIELTGSGFLYNMVRIISGTLLDVGIGKIKPEEIKNIIEAKDRKKAGRTLPAHGLCLMEVNY